MPIACRWLRHFVVVWKSEVETYTCGLRKINTKTLQILPDYMFPVPMTCTYHALTTDQDPRVTIKLAQPSPGFRHSRSLHSFIHARHEGSLRNMSQPFTISLRKATNAEETLEDDGKRRSAFYTAAWNILGLVVGRIMKSKASQRILSLPSQIPCELQSRYMCVQRRTLLPFPSHRIHNP